MTLRATIFALLLSLFLIPRNAFAGDDACRHQLPKELVSAIAERFPEHRTPRENDNLAEDVGWARNHGGSACLGVASGNFYGDGKMQWVVALRSKKNADSSLIIVARRSHSGWHFDKLLLWPTLASHLYVAREPPGHYDRADRDPTNKNEAEQLKCEHDAIAIGETEAGQLNYCQVMGKWLSITVAE